MTEATVQPPGVQPPGVIGYSGDFRSAAVAESAELLAGTSLDPAEAGVSLCVKADEDPVANRYVRFGATASSFGGIACGLLAAVVLAVSVVIENGSLALAGGGFMVVVLVVILLESYWRNANARRAVRNTRMVPDYPRPVCFNLEDGFTFSRVKIAPDDVVLLWADPHRQVIRMEGLTHRYVIHARDVVRVQLRWAPGTNGIVIAYRIRCAELVLVLYESQGNIIETLKQLVGFPPRTYAMIRDAIGCGPRIAPLPPPTLPQPPTLPRS